MCRDMKQGEKTVEKDEIRKIIERFTWKFAKSMPKIPHEYTVKNKNSVQDSKDYERLYFFIKNNCYIKYFYGKPYKYCDIDDYTYWIMTDDVRESIIINRTKKNRG